MSRHLPYFALSAAAFVAVAWACRPGPDAAPPAGSASAVDPAEPRRPTPAAATSASAAMPGPGTAAPRREATVDAVAVLGRVVDAGGNPLAAARVELLFVGTGEAIAAARCDDDGSFRLLFAAPTPHLLTLVTRCPGHAAAVVERTNAGDHNDLDFGDVTLAGGGTLHGRVVDDAGRGVPEATLQVLPVAGPLRALPAAALADFATTTIASDGTFALGDLPPGAYRLAAVAAARARGVSSRVALVAGATVEVEPLVLRQGHTLAGAVFDRVGAAATNCVAELVAATGERDVLRTATDAAGRFAFDHLPAGSYHLRVRGGDGAVQQLRWLDADQPGPVVVRLQAPVVLRGRVVEADGAPVPRFEVRLRRWDAEDARLSAAEQAGLAGFATAHGVGEAALDEALHGFAALAAQRRSREREAAPFGVELLCARGSDGAFAITTAAPDTWVLEIAVPGRPVLQFPPLPLADGVETREFRLPPREAASYR